MAKTPTQVASLARSHTESAIRVLAAIMNKEDAAEPSRIQAANSLLDRGWGKPAQPVAGDGDGGPVRLLIERVIRDSNPPD